LEPGRRIAQRVWIARLDDDLDGRPARTERRIRAYDDTRPAISRLDERGRDHALARAIDAPPRADRAAATELLRDRVEHRLHLGRKPGQHVDVLDREAGRTAERILDRPRSARQRRPANGPLRIAREAGTQRCREL